MTPPTIVFDAAKHKYWIDGEPVPSVTQILGIIDKSGPLSWWGMTVGVEAVCQLQRTGEEIPWEDPEGVTKLVTARKLSTNHVKTKAGTRGSSLHDALEAFLTREAIPNPVDYPVEDRGYVQALARALLELRPTVIEAEVIVGSKDYRFAGRFDLLASVGGIVTRLDLKSSKNVYPEQHFPQLEAYEFAAVECGHRSSGRRCVLRLGVDGEFEFVESTACFDDFLAIKRAYEAVQGIKRSAKLAKRAAA